MTTHVRSSMSAALAQWYWCPTIDPGVVSLSLSTNVHIPHVVLHCNTWVNIGCM